MSSASKSGSLPKEGASAPALSGDAGGTAVGAAGTAGAGGAEVAATSVAKGVVVAVAGTAGGGYDVWETSKTAGRGSS
jgi:hypothetical protein